MTTITGRKIVKVRAMTQAEMNEQGWEARWGDIPVLELDDGTLLYASQDDEGNGPGTMFGVKPDGTSFYPRTEEA